MSTGLFTNAFLGSMGYGGGSRSPAINLTSVSSGSNGNWVALFPNSISPNYSATGTQALYNGSGGVWLAASESSGRSRRSCGLLVDVPLFLCHAQADDNDQAK